MSGYKIFTGANGYYIAHERDDGFHYQPADNGASIGWDRAAARRALREAIDEADEHEPRRGDEEVR